MYAKTGNINNEKTRLNGYTEKGLKLLFMVLFKKLRYLLKKIKSIFAFMIKRRESMFIY